MNTPESVEHLAQLEYQGYIANPKLQNVRNLRGNALRSYLEPIEKTPFKYLQKSVLIGCLLGDGTLQYNGGSRPFLKFDQKVENKSYVDFIYNIFEDIIGTPPRLRRVRDQDHSWWFRTFRSTRLHFFAQQFYKIDSLGNRRRVVPQNIHQWLNPIVLAIWFMDDGGTEHSGYRLHTECFSLDDQRVLQQALGSVFHLQSNIRRDTRPDRVLYYLYIPAESTQLFKTLVEPYMLECMRYKLVLH